MINRTFVIRLSPPRGADFAQYHHCSVPWPDWRSPDDYLGFDINPESPWAFLDRLADAWRGDKELPEWLLPPKSGAGRRLASLTKERLADRHMAWAFLRRNQDYQRDWAEWWRAREKDQLVNSSVTWEDREKAANKLRVQYRIETEFQKPPSPFDGSMPVFCSENKQLDNEHVVKIKQENGAGEVIASGNVPNGPFLDFRIFLDQPIAKQIAELQLKLESVIDIGGVQDQRAKRRRPANYLSYLRVLDGLAAGAPKAELAAVIFPGAGGGKRLEYATKAAIDMTTSGYLDLIRRHASLD